MRTKYATFHENNIGRLFDEKVGLNGVFDSDVKADKVCDGRTSFEHDRDRIIHSRALRRLKHKTQVFIAPEGDHYRTRLTHSLEVSQIARGFARRLLLDEDLTEAIALAHDFGHTPFGHVGEQVLNKLMAEFGGFNHNLQSLRLVMNLEKKYPSFDGLNLTIDSYEGMIKHGGRLFDNDGKPLRDYLKPDIPPEISKLIDAGMNKFGYASLEAQIAEISDDIAYNAHDMDDGFRAGLIEIEEICEIDLIKNIINSVDIKWPKLERQRRINELVRRFINIIFQDVLSETLKRVNENNIENLKMVKNANISLVGISDEILPSFMKLKDFLMKNLYLHEDVEARSAEAEIILKGLFNHYINQPDELHAQWRTLDLFDGEKQKMRLICDYIAGMTDQYAIRDFKNKFPSKKLKYL